MLRSDGSTKAGSRSSDAGRIKGRPRSRPIGISERFIETICRRLGENKRIRRKLPVWGRLHIDRQLPFLCVYRKPVDGDDLGTERLVTGEASYLIASGDRRLHEGLARLVSGIAKIMVDAFGSFLVVEVWAATSAAASEGDSGYKPTFRIVKAKKSELTATIASLERALGEIRIQNQIADVEVLTSARPCPSKFRSLIPPAEAKRLGCHVLGIEVHPVYLDPETGQEFPQMRRALRRRLARAYKLGFFEFTRRNTTHRPPHYHALGPRAMVKAVWTADQRLARISSSFDFLLGVTPVDSDAAWSSFKRRRCQREPEFSYRPIPVDPALLKRELFKIPIERIEDPTLAQLFRDQQFEIDRKISMLADRNTRQFLFGSLGLFGTVDDGLFAVAQGIIDKLPSRTREPKGSRYVDAEGFAARARESFDYLRLTHPQLASKVEVRKDIVGLMVSRGDLLIGSRTRVAVARVPAALAHEVETHVLTYLNGRAQPFKQLYVGLPGYEELQEGLAVLAEHLVGGLTAPRLRLLAARVIAARRLIDGASFIDVFRELDRTLDFDQRTAFAVAMRVFRGGGLTKDAVYLRGLLQLLDYLKSGGLIETLFVGKLAVEHVPIVQELQLRHVLGSPLLRPRYLEDPASAQRLERVRQGASALDLVAG